MADSTTTTAGTKIVNGLAEALRAVTLRKAVYDIDGFEMTSQEAIDVLGKVDAVMADSDTTADPQTVAYYVEREMADLRERNALHAEIDRLRNALEEYACPGRGACMFLSTELGGDEFWSGIWWVPDGTGKVRNATLRECAEEIRRLRDQLAAYAVKEQTPINDTTIVVGRVTGTEYEGNQCPGMPRAICHACGLGWRCWNPDCEQIGQASDILHGPTEK